MTEKTFNYTLRYYLFQMGRLKTLTIFSCLFAVLGFPLLAVASNLERFTTSHYDEIIAPMYVISIIGICGMALLSFITPIAAFKHLYTKTSADNILSLPLTTTQRFIGDMGSILTSYCLPMGISAVLTLIAENITIAVLNKQTPSDLSQYALIAFLCTFQFIMLNSAITVCCGRMVEAMLYPVAVNLVMPLAITYGGEIAFINAFGIMSSGTMEVMQSPIYNMFPFSFLLNLTSSLNLNILWGMLFTLLYLGLAYLGYRKRLAQNIGKSFVFKYSYLIATTIVGIAFIISYIWLVDMSYLYNCYAPQFGTVVTIAVVLLIMLLIMELINYKKIHSIPKFILHYAGTMGGGFLIFFLLIWSGGFGAGYYVPSADKIESATMFGFYRESDWENGVENTIDAVEDEAISLILEEHNYIVDNHDNDNEVSQDDSMPIHELYSTENLGYSIFNTSFHYIMKDGTRIDRNYSLDYTTKDLWERMFRTESYRLRLINSIKEWRLWQDEELTYEIRLLNAHSDKVYIKFESENLLESEIFKALEADLKADTEFGRRNENALGVVQIGYHVYSSADKQYYYSPLHNFRIFESYTNTIEVLSKHGEVPSLETVIEDSTKNCEIFMLQRTPTGGIDIAAENVYGSFGENEVIFITAEEFKELTSKQVKYNIFDGEDTSDDYQYTLIRGGWENFDQIRDKNIIIETLEKDGLGLDNYDFIDNYTSDVFSKAITDSTINTEYNSYCDELFAKRTKLAVKEVETPYYDTNGEISAHEVHEKIVVVE